MFRRLCLLDKRTMLLHASHRQYEVLSVTSVFKLSFSVGTIKASAADDGYKQCEYIVKKWASSSVDSKIKEDKHALRDLLFFLHVPRTGGRTYFHWYNFYWYYCALSHDLMPPSQKIENRILSLNIF